jgi:transcriptional regulator with XRE-family HTH domain
MKTALGERLRRLRKEKEWMMEQLAEAAGVSKSYIWELENRPAQRPSADKLNGIAKALGVAVQDLMGEPPPVEAEPEDVRFFRQYLGMSDADKARYRQMMELMKKK